MPPPPERLLDDKRALLKELLDAYKEEYKELFETWESLERKAQSLATIAGLFLTGLFTFTRLTDATPGAATSLSSAVLKEPMAKAILYGVTGFLVTTVLLAILALKARKISKVSKATLARNLVNDLWRSRDSTNLSESVPGFFYNFALGLEPTLEDLKGVNRAKGKLLLWAQSFLLVAGILAGALIMFRIYSL